jgi:hypothetical protein
MGFSITDEIKEYNIGVASSGTNVIPDFVKTGQQVQKLKRGNRQLSQAYFFGRE